MTQPAFYANVPSLPDFALPSPGACLPLRDDAFLALDLLPATAAVESYSFYAFLLNVPDLALSPSGASLPLRDDASLALPLPVPAAFESNSFCASLSTGRGQYARCAQDRFPLDQIPLVCR